MKATAKQSRLVRGVIDLAGGAGGSGSPDEPVDQRGEGATVGFTAVTEGGAEARKLGRPQGRKHQDNTASAVQRKDGKPTRAERSQKNKEMRHQVLAEELQEKRREQQVWVGDQQLTGEDFRLATIRQAGLRQPGAKPTGRLSEYTDEKAEAICTWIRQGKSLNSYCKQAGMGIETPYRWMRTVPRFREMYEQAQEDRADTLADQLLAVVDDLPPDATMEQVQIARLRLDARKWVASKLRPTRWGDKQTVEHTGGGISINIGIPQKPAAPPPEAEDVTPR